MAVSTVTANLLDGSLVLSDGTGTPVTLTVPCSVGDTSIDALMALSGITGEYNETVAYECRGALDSVRHSTRIYPSISFTAHMRDATSGSAGNVLDFVRQLNAYSANLSTLDAGADADVYCIDIILTIEKSDHGGTDSVITATNCRVVATLAEGDPNTISFAGICYGTVTSTGPV